MSLSPAFEDFERLYQSGSAQVVYRQILADTQTPISALMKLGAEQPYTSLFESVEGGATLGRYSFIALDPDLVWKREGGQTLINREFADNPQSFVHEDAGGRNPLDSLAALHACSAITLPPDLPPMSAGLVGFFGYDTVRHIERLPTDKPDMLGTPEALFMRPRLTAVFDRVRDLITLVSPVYPNPGQGALAAYEAAASRLAEAMDRLEGPLPAAPVPEGLGDLPVPKSNMLSLIHI